MSGSAVDDRPLQQAGPSFSATRCSGRPPQSLEQRKQKQTPGQPAQTGTVPIPLFLRIPSTRHHKLSVQGIFSSLRLLLSFVFSMLQNDRVNRFFSSLPSPLQLNSTRYIVFICPLTVPHSSPRARSHDLPTDQSFLLYSTDRENA